MSHVIADSQSSDLGDSADDESGSIYSENISENVISNNEKLKALLVEWKSPSFYEILLRNDIDFEKLDSLEDPFYDNLIKNGEESLGNLLLFRRYHMKWKDSIVCIQFTLENTTINELFCSSSATYSPIIRPTM